MLRHNMTCPECGNFTDTVTDPIGKPALLRPGSVMICLYCGHVSIVADTHGNVREPTTDESLEIHQDPLMRLVLACRKMVMERKKEKPHGKG